MPVTTEAVPDKSMRIGFRTLVKSQRPGFFFPGAMSVLPIAGHEAVATFFLASLLAIMSTADRAGR